MTAAERQQQVLEIIQRLGPNAAGDDVAREAGVHKRTVMTAVGTLKALGLVTCVKGITGGLTATTLPRAAQRRATDQRLRTDIDSLGEGLVQQRLQDRQLGRMLAREDLFLRSFEESATRMFAKPIRVTPFPAKKAAKEERVVNVLLSDTHFGSRLDPREVPTRYGTAEEARRLGKIVREVSMYKRPHRAESSLAVHLGGDIIQGQLHDLRDGAPLAEQCAGALHLLHQALARFAAEWPRVIVRCTPGNHGRNTSRHHGRAVHQKWDGHEMLIYRALQQCLKTVPNVHFHPETDGKIPLTPYYIYEQLGHRGLITHGDTVFNPGSPNRSIDTGAAATQIQRWNATESQAGRGRITVFATGHVHVASASQVPGSDEWFITNGALLPADSFAVSVGMTGTSGTQMLWETTAKYAVGDIRFLKVGVGEDRDAGLEKIIAPFEM